MTLEDFRESLKKSNPPESIGEKMLALWHDAHGNWDRAHEIANSIDDQEGAWIHAYLHRKEGDLWNADYWYRRAGRVRPGSSLEVEWHALSHYFLASQ